MRFFTIPLFVVFSFTIPTMSLAGSIFEIDIDGISIGDSLLNHFDERKIKSWKTTDYSSIGKDKTFVRIENSDAKFRKYDRMSFHIKPNDKNYTIYGISASKIFGEQDIELCLSLKKTEVSQLV